MRRTRSRRDSLRLSCRRFQRRTTRKRFSRLRRVCRRVRCLVIFAKRAFVARRAVWLILSGPLRMTHRRMIWMRWRRRTLVLVCVFRWIMWRRSARAWMMRLSSVSGSVFGRSSVGIPLSRSSSGMRVLIRMCVLVIGSCFRLMFHLRGIRRRLLRCRICLMGVVWLM